MKFKLATLSAAIVIAASNFCIGVGSLGVLNNAQATRYCGSGNVTEISETINFARKETTSDYAMKGNVPNYSAHVDASNCANVAGAELIGYYDRFYEDLIPNYKSYVQMGTMLAYRSAGAETAEVMKALKIYMGTTDGTTFNGFHKGMKTYVEEHSLTYSTEDLGSLNLDKYKAAVESNKPVALFLGDYSFYLGATSNANGETIKSEHSSVAHVVVGCGYKIDTYYNSEGKVVATRTYLKVASGFDSYGVVYLCLDGKSTVDRATSVIIS